MHLKKIEYGEKVFSCNLFQKVKLSYILDSLHVNHFKSCFYFILMITANESQKSVSQNIRIFTFECMYPYSINSGYLLFFETTIMGNTADLAMVQKMIIESSHRGSLLKGVAHHRVLYQSILNAKLTKKEVG